MSVIQLNLHRSHTAKADLDRRNALIEILQEPPFSMWGNSTLKKLNSEVYSVPGIRPRAAIRTDKSVTSSAILNLWDRDSVVCLVKTSQGKCVFASI